MNVSQQVSFSRTTVKKIGDRACQRDMGQSYPFISVLVLITRVIWSFYCSRVFKLILHGYLKKNLQLVSTLFKSTSNFKEVKKRWSIFKIGFWTSKQPFATNFLPSTLQYLQSQKLLRKHKDSITGDGFFWKKI